MTTDATYTALPGQNKPGENSSPLTEAGLPQNGNTSNVLHIKNVPLELIDMISTSWQTCGLYTKEGKAKNTNPTARAIDTWILLKTVTSSGTIHNYRKQLNTLAYICKIKMGSLRTRLTWLKNHKLIHTTGKNLFLHSYQALEDEFGIDTTKRTTKTIWYDTNDNTKLAEKLISLGIDRMKESSRYMYNKKIHKRAEARVVIGNHAIAYGANQEKMGSSEYFRHSHLVLQNKTYVEEDAGETSFFIAHQYCDANPDLNLTQATIGRRTGLSVMRRQDAYTKRDISQSIGAGHLLRRLEAKGIIKIERGLLLSEHMARKDEKIFHHSYVRELKQTMWRRPNQISLNNQNIFVGTN